MIFPRHQPDSTPLRDIQRLAAAFNLPTLAVGANARILVFDAPLGIEPHRFTTDWDIGVKVQKWDQYNQLLQHAIDSGLFSATPNEHRLIHIVTGMPLDLIPFGGVALAGIIHWPRTGTEMTVTGFEEAIETSTAVDLGDGTTINVPALPLMVVLKLFAFNDRGAQINRDLGDVMHIIVNYPMRGREADRFVEPYLSTLGDEAGDAEVGALFLGWDIAQLCKRATIQQLQPILWLLTDPYGAGVTSIIGPTYDAEREQSKREHASSIFRRLSQGMSLVTTRQ